MATKLFRPLSDTTFERIIVEDPAPYLADGWTLTAEAPKKVEEEAPAKPKRTRRKKAED